MAGSASGKADITVFSVLGLTAVSPVGPGLSEVQECPEFRRTSVSNIRVSSTSVSNVGVPRICLILPMGTVILVMRPPLSNRDLCAVDNEALPASVVDPSTCCVTLCSVCSSISGGEDLLAPVNISLKSSYLRHLQSPSVVDMKGRSR